MLTASVITLVCLIVGLGISGPREIFKSLGITGLALLLIAAQKHSERQHTFTPVQLCYAAVATVYDLPLSKVSLQASSAAQPPPQRFQLRTGSAHNGTLQLTGCRVHRNRITLSIPTMPNPRQHITYTTVSRMLEITHTHNGKFIASESFHPIDFNALAKH